MDGIVHGVAKSRTRLSDFHFSVPRPAQPHPETSHSRAQPGRGQGHLDVLSLQPDPAALLWP